MFALITGSVVVYVIVLIAVGIYVATRVMGGGDYFTSDGVKLAAVIVFALLSAIPTDVLTAIWLTVVRDHIDVTANLNLFLVAVAPVVTVIVAVQALLLSRAYRSRPLPARGDLSRLVRGRPRLLDGKAVCVYLASDAASWVSGEILRVGGGARPR